MSQRAQGDMGLGSDDEVIVGIDLENPSRPDKVTGHADMVA